MLPTIVRAILIAWLAALCAMAGGAPAARAQRDDLGGESRLQLEPHDATINSTAHRLDARPAPRRRGTDQALLAIVTETCTVVAPPRVTLHAPLATSSLPFVALVLPRSSRGPPLG